MGKPVHVIEDDQCRNCGPGTLWWDKYHGRWRCRKGKQEHRGSGPSQAPEHNRSRARKSKLFIKYGITEEDYERMLEEQDHLCAICREPCSSGRRLAVDHCHLTGKVRGLLCMNCNIALGKLKDSVKIAQSLIRYLEEQ